MQIDKEQFQHLMQNGQDMIHMDRGSYTHKTFWQDVKGLGESQEIHDGGEPIPVPALGRNLQVGDVLQERLALGVDADGNVLPQSEFQSRYLLYLAGFKTDADVNLEPVPSVKQFLMKQLDPARPQSDGRAHLVDIGFDATKNRTPQETGMWHPDGIPMDEWRKRNPEAAAALAGGPSEFETKVKQLAELRAKGAISQEDMVNEIAALSMPEEAVEVPVVVAAEPAQETPAEPAMATAPCGKKVKERGLVAHTMRCKRPECEERDAIRRAGESTTPPEAA